MGYLTLKGAKALANANYEYGGDYVLELFTDSEIESRFCGPGGKKRLYDYMSSVEEMRNYAAGLL